MGTKVSVIVVGIGGRGAWVAETVHGSEHYELVALCDKKKKKADGMAAKLDDSRVKVFASLEEALAGCDFDAVIIATDDCHHAEVAVPALEAGKFVYAEKPLDTTWEKCAAVIDADEKAGGKTFAGFNLRHAPVYSTIRAMIDKGKIGKVLTIEANEFYRGGRTYFRRWNRLRSRGGGLWITKACHDFDLINWMAGDEPVTVSAFSALSHYKPRADAPLYCLDCDKKFTCPDSRYKNMDPESLPSEADIALDREESNMSDLCLWNSDKDTFDHGSAIVCFAGGATACYTCNVVSSFSNRELRVSGTEGCLEGDLGAQEVVCRKRYTDEVERIDVSARARGGHGGADLNIIDTFAEFVRGKDVPVVRPLEAAVSIAMGLAARLSADENRVVDLKEIAGE